MFPQVYKAGFVFGGAVGDGALRVGGQTVQYYRTTAVSWGFQVGAQARTEVVLFMTQDALDRFRAGNGWQAGVDGSIAVINFGAGNSIDTDNIQEPIIGFIFDDKGLMFDLSFKGQQVLEDRRLTKRQLASAKQSGAAALQIEQPAFRRRGRRRIPSAIRRCRSRDGTG